MSNEDEKDSALIPSPPSALSRGGAASLATRGLKDLLKTTVRKPRVLVVDGDHTIADTLTLILNQAGFEARAVYSNTDEIELSRDIRPELIIDDIMWTGAEGIDAAILILESLPSCKFLFLSGTRKEYQLEYARTRGHKFEMLSMPVHPQDLLAWLRNHLERKNRWCEKANVEDLRKLCESQFECDVFDCLIERGYYVTPQVPVGQYRIDMVIEGANDARLAIECDGDRYNRPDKWAEDNQRQRVLERAGWVFWRCLASAWIRRRDELLKDLLSRLYQLGIEPRER